MLTKLTEARNLLRHNEPLILNITNLVTIEFVANTQLAIGAKPIMTQCREELAELIAHASALYVNLGTLEPRFIALAEEAIHLARAKRLPIALDPVGAGATAIRTQTARAFAPQVDLVRGNASEILALCTQHAQSKGVESLHATTEAMPSAVSLAQQLHNTVVVSGATDFITNGHRSQVITQGSAIMQQITGMGCALTGVIAAFMAVLPDTQTAGTLASLFFSLCGEIAATNSQWVGSFKTAFLDQLQAAELHALQARCLVYQEEI